MPKLKRIGKSAFALFMVGILAFMPVNASFALEDNYASSDSNLNIIMEEIEEDSGNDEGIKQPEINLENKSEENEETTTVPDVDNEDQTETEDENEDGSNPVNNSADDRAEGENLETEEAEGDNAEENEMQDDKTLDNEGAELIGGEEDLKEDEEAADTNAQDDEEADANTEESKEELPGLKNYTLTKDQLEIKMDLADHLDEISEGEEGIDYASGELVFLADTLEEAEKIARGYGGRLKSFDLGIGVVTLSKELRVASALTIAATSEDIVLPPAWPNYIYTICTEEADGIEEADEEEFEAPETAEADEVYTDDATYTEAAQSFNDPYLNPASSYYQYQHMMVGSVYAWNAGYTGAGIKIAILDTGVNPHTELTIVKNENYSSDSSASDGHGHGTHVAGLAAAKKNNYAGGAGIAPDASIYNIKVMNSSGSGTSADIMRGVQAAIDYKVDIINMSLGSHWYDGNYATVIKSAYNSGIAVFAAAGNDGSKVKCYPACYPGTYCIGAVQQDKGRSYFSNYGSWVKFSAPGSNLLSSSNSGGYAEMSGTSQATPVASGTAAVILSADAGIREKTGKARVDALISKMNKGKIAGSGGAAGIVSLPKVLGIPVSTAAPKAPVFATKAQTITGTSLDVTITPVVSTDVIYYSLDGKNPTFKNGVFSANTIRYTSPISIGGKAKITVKAIAVNSCGKVSKVSSATYTFKPLVSNVTVTGQKKLVRGNSTSLKASVTPDYAAVKTVTWSIEPGSKGVTVDKNGKVKAAKTAEAITYTVTATSKDDGKKSGTFEITVAETAKVKSVAFRDPNTGKAKKSDTITIGNSNETYNLAALLLVTYTNNADNTNDTKSFIEDVDFSSSNTNVATVSARGIATTAATGKAVITATANDGSGKKATFTLTVKRRITSVTVNGLSKLAVGQSAKMTVTVNSDAAKKTVTWKVSPGNQGVTVSSKGIVKTSKTAAEGLYTITATSADGSGVYGSKTIKVSNNAITKIKLNSSKETIFRTSGNYSSKTTTQLTATITAQTAAKQPAVSDAVEFVSSNPGIATVKQSGTTATITVTGSTTGTTKITCKALDGSGKSATCKVTVVNPASRLTVTPPGGNAGYVATGKTIKLSAVFEEDFGPVSSRKVTWSSSNSAIATVNSSGKVKGISQGSVSITATAKDGSGLKHTRWINISEPIKKIGLDGVPSKQTYTLNKSYDHMVLYNDFTYSYGACPYVNIVVGNPDIISAQWISVSSIGSTIRIYAKKKGKTNLTIKAMDATNKKKTYTITVK